MNAQNAAAANIQVWDHWAVNWREATPEELASYAPPQDGHLLGHVATGEGRYNTRTEDQKFSDYTGNVSVGSSGDTIFFESGQITSTTPSCSIAASVIAMQLGLGMRSGTACGRDWTAA